MIGPLVEKGEERINDDHNGNYDLLCLCHQCDDAFTPVTRAQLEGAHISLAKRHYGTDSQVGRLSANTSFRS